MRTPNLGSVQYSPADVPADPLQAYLRDELNKIAAAVNALAAGHLDMQTSAPVKPRNGDIRYANGTTWNPIAAGAGIYWFNGSVWAKL
jgi:hypothetical protein